MLIGRQNNFLNLRRKNWDMLTLSTTLYNLVPNPQAWSQDRASKPIVIIAKAYFYIYNRRKFPSSLESSYS